MLAALSNAVLHGNHEDPRKQLHIMCRWDQARKCPSLSGMKHKTLTRPPLCIPPSWRVRNPTISQEFS